MKLDKLLTNILMNNYQFKTPSFDDKHWLAFRQVLYHDLDLAFNQQEMKLVETSDDWQSCILYNSSTPIGMHEISLRNVVDGCLTSPVAYLEGIYLIPEYLHNGISNMMLDKVKEWARGKG